MKNKSTKKSSRALRHEADLVLKNLLRVLDREAKRHVALSKKLLASQQKQIRELQQWIDATKKPKGKRKRR